MSAVSSRTVLVIAALAITVMFPEAASARKTPQVVAEKPSQWAADRDSEPPPVPPQEYVPPIPRAIVPPPLPDVPLEGPGGTREEAAREWKEILAWAKAARSAGVDAKEYEREAAVSVRELELLAKKKLSEDESARIVELFSFSPRRRAGLLSATEEHIRTLTLRQRDIVNGIRERYPAAVRAMEKNDPDAAAELCRTGAWVRSSNRSLLELSRESTKRRFEEHFRTIEAGRKRIERLEAIERKLGSTVASR